MRIKINQNSITNPAEFVKAVAAHSAFRKLDILDSDRGDTGYYEHLATRPIADGLWTFNDNNRYGIVAATPIGNVVFFQRYTNGDRGAVVCNVARNLRPISYMLGLRGAITIEQMCSVLDDLGGHNSWILDSVKTAVSDMVELAINPKVDEENLD